VVVESEKVQSALYGLGPNALRYPSDSYQPPSKESARLKLGNLGRSGEMSGSQQNSGVYRGVGESKKTT